MVYHYYFIPFKPGKKALFFLFPKFFYNGGPFDQRGEQKGEDASCPSTQPQGVRTEQAKIECGTHRQCGGGVQPKLSSVHCQGKGKQGDCHPQPEQKIQYEGHALDGQGVPDKAKQVVKKACDHPCGNRKKQGKCLPLHRDLHQRKSRANKPPPRSLRVS